MGKDRIYFILFASVVLLYVAFQVFGPQPVNWENSFSGSDTIPYGSYILRQELSTLFPGDEIRTMRAPIYEELSGIDSMDEQSVNRIFINSVFRPDPIESGMLLRAVRRGDHLFISANQISEHLADSLGLQIEFDVDIFGTDSPGSPPVQGNASVGANFWNSDLSAPKSWNFEIQRRTYFSGVDSLNSRNLGYLTGSKKSNFISIEQGSGKVFIHLLPRAFTNYYLRDPEYASYAFKALSYLPEQETIWDEYYKDGRSQYTTPMGYILSEPSLEKAWYLTITGILLFMVFKGRRMQRPVPVRVMPQNTTLEFAKTIGSLYLEKGTHKDMADKKIRFFRDWCREHLGIMFTRYEQPSPEKIAAQSGVSTEQANELFTLISETEKAATISKEQLETVTSAIDKFYKKSKR